ncbi:MAG: hypothetical protein IKW60_00725 [Clostridia bacterium]|nr:hypothetical protein [Clostridia bacterium]
MKKTVIIGSICGILLFGTVISFAGGTAQKIIDSFEETKLFAQYEKEDVNERLKTKRRKEKIDKSKKNDKWGKMSKFDQMLIAMDATIENAIEYNDVLFNYEYLRQAYHWSQEQLDYVSDLIIKGYPAMDIMDICYFWMDTNEDISIIEEIYLHKEGSSAVTWIERAFNDVTNDKCGVLTGEDVEAYLENGLTLEDIALANKLCRRGSMTIQEILEKKRNGFSFAEITTEVHGENINELPAVILNQSKKREVKHGKPEQDIISHRAVEKAEKLSRISKKSRKELYQKELEEESIAQELELTEDALRTKIQKELGEKGLFRLVTTEDEKDNMMQEAKYENQ